MVVKLTRRAVVQVAVETTYNTPAAVGNSDGVLVSDPDFSIDPQVLERDIVNQDLSPSAIIMGRKLAQMTFTTELRSNGKRTGLLADAPLITRLFRACGFSMTLQSAPDSYGPFAVGDHANEVVWAVDDSAVTATDVIAYYVEVTTGGASGTAAVTISSDTAGEESASAVLTSGTVKSLGTKGLKMTPTFTGNLVVGQRWVVWATPIGIRLDPVSDNFESVTLVMNKDGIKHSMPGSFGTFEITAEAGQYASIDWTFTGTYSAPVDAVLANPSYEKTLPSMVELARLRIDNFAAIVNQFTFDLGQEINVRPDVSSSDGYIGTRITSRAPEGGIDPEADSVASHDFWGRLATGNRMPFQMRVGKNVGNSVWFFAGCAQYSGMSYQDRDGIMNYDAGLRFARTNGNDECMFFFA